MISNCISCSSFCLLTYVFEPRYYLGTAPDDPSQAKQSVGANKVNIVLSFVV